MPPPPLVPPPADPPALLAPGRLSRRRLFKALGFGGLALAGGAWIYKTLWKLGPPAPGRVCLTRDEMAINEKLAEAFFPGPPEVPFSAEEIDLPAFVDRYIGGLYDDNIRLFKLLFRAINLAPVLSYGRSFYWLPLAKRREVLEEWDSSDVLARRAGYASLRFVYGLGYFEDDRVREKVGLKFGCALEGRAPPPDDPVSPPELAVDRSG
jgi:hypothetical protein